MKLKYRIIFFFTLLAVVWSISYSILIFFQFNLESYSSVSSTQHLNSSENNFLFFNLVPIKVEENTELTDYKKNKKESTLVFIDFSLKELLSFKYQEKITHYSDPFPQKKCLFIKYCSLKIPY